MATSSPKSALASGPTNWRSKTLLGSASAAGLAADIRHEREKLVRFAVIAPETIAWRVRQRVLREASAKCVDVEIRCAAGPIWVQPQSFSAALYALVHNAVRASRNGYPVILDVHEVGDVDIVWQVQDMGEGMAARELAALGRVAPEGPLARLGVPFAWAVVEAHGGLLHFESAIGVGTTATIWLSGGSRKNSWVQE